MTYAPHCLITVTGSLPGGETWSCGLRFGIDILAPTQAQIQAVANECRTPWATFIAASGTYLSSGVTGDKITARLIQPDGKARLAAEAAFGTPPVGSGSILMPNEVCLVVTLKTDTPTRSGRGRIYLPTLAVQMGAGGVLASGTASSIAAPARQLFVTLGQAVADGFDTGADNYPLVVASNVDEINRPVTSIRVGNVPDVQRRRQFSLNEQFANLPYPA